MCDDARGIGTGAIHTAIYHVSRSYITQETDGGAGRLVQVGTRAN